MKQLLHIFIFLFVLSNTSIAQRDKDKIEALRMNFITKKLDLTINESEKFWPIYNEYNDKLKAIKKNIRQSYKRKSENLTDKDAEDLITLELQSKQAEADLFKVYSEKLKSIIGSKKLVKLHVAEEEFKREIINSIREKNF